MADPIPLRPTDADAGFRKEGMGYVLEPPGFDVRLAADFVTRTGSTVHAQLEVTCTIAGLFPRLYYGEVNLSGTRARNDLSAYLTRVSRDRVPSEQWDQLIQFFGDSVLAHENRGTPLLRLGRLPRGDGRPDVIGQLVQQHKSTILFGPGGAGKGWLAIYMAVCATLGIPCLGLPVNRLTPLYIDGEDDAETFNDRIQAVAAGLDVQAPEIPWWKPSGPLPRRVNELARRVDEASSGLVFCDSVGRLFGAPGEHAGWETVAVQGEQAFLAAQGAVGPFSRVLIDHVNAQGFEAPKLAGRPSGAIRKLYDARVGWEVRNAQEAESSTVHVALYHAKWNHTQRFRPIGARLEFLESDAWGRATRVRISREDVRDVDALAERLGHPERFLAALRRSHLSTPELADLLELKANQVRNIGAALKRTGHVVSWGGADGKGGRNNAQTWALADHSGAEKSALPLTNRTSALLGGQAHPTQSAQSAPHKAHTSAVSPPASVNAGWFPGAEDDDEAVPF